MKPRTSAAMGTGCSTIAVLLLTGCIPAKAPYTARATETVPTSIAATVAESTADASITPPVPTNPHPTRLDGPAVILDGISQVPARVSLGDYRRAAFGETWTDDNDAPGGHNGCDTRNDILNRDLVDKTHKSISRCPNAVATGTLYDPYTGTIIAFTRGSQTGAAVQIDHIVPLAYAWDMGARDWPADVRVRFANDPANLLAVQGDSNQSKGDKEPAKWMPPNATFDCQYVTRFTDVLRAYGLPIDVPSAAVITKAAATCPAS